MKHFERDLGFAFLGVLFLFLVRLPGGFLFSWAAWIFVFLIFLNAKDGKEGVLGLLGWSAVIGIVYYAVMWAFLRQYSLTAYFQVVSGSLPAIPLFLVLIYVLIPSGPFTLRGALYAGLAWMLIEWVYGLSFLSGLALQFPFYGPEPFLRFASVTGFGLFPGIVLALDFSLAVFIKRREPLAGKAALAFTLVLLAVGGLGMFHPAERSSGNVRVAVIQTNLPPEGPWSSEHMAEVREIYDRLAQEALRSNPDLIIFPQYTLSEITQKDLVFFPELARKIKKPILFASHAPADAATDPSYAYPPHVNEAFLVGLSGNIEGSYQAIRAPFTEKGVRRSKQYQVINAPFGKIGMLLCYEDLFSSVVQKATDAGAEFLVALSNPSALRGDFVARMHLFQDQLRSIESGRYLIRLTPNGYSAVVDPAGRVLQRTEHYHEGILIADIPKITGKTIFHRICYFIPPFFVLLAMGLLFKRKS